MTLYHAALHQCVHEEVIPAPMLCQQKIFKLSAAFSFQFQQHAFFHVGGYQNENIPHVIMLWIAIKSIILMYHKVQLQSKDFTHYKLYVRSREAYPHIVKQHGKRRLRVIAFQSLQQMFFHVLAGSSTAGLNLVQILPGDTGCHGDFIL